MVKEIVYQELIKSFKLVDGNLFRLWRGEYWKEVSLEANRSDGYCDIGWNGKKFKAHRILYSLHHKCDVDSSLVIDHQNGDKIDNRPENIRLVDNRENQNNRTSHREGRLVGCYFHKHNQKWMTQIQINKKLCFLGYYSTEQQAHEAYLVALECLEWEMTGKQIQGIINELRKENCL